MGYRRLFIMRKDLNMSPGKLAAQVAHCAEAYWTNELKKYTTKKFLNMYLAVQPDGKQQHYLLSSLDDLAHEEYEKGEYYFFANKNNGIFELAEPEYFYSTKFVFDSDTYENYVNASFTKTICGAKNKYQLLKAKTKAEELGLIEGIDFGLIYDNCLTELTPEEENGTCLTGIWFAPLPDEIAHQISRKYQLL